MMASRQPYGAHYRLSFRAWLYQHRNNPDAVGEIARIVMADGCLTSRIRTRDAYVFHLRYIHGASPQVTAIFEQVWQRFQHEQSKHEQSKHEQSKHEQSKHEQSKHEQKT